MSEKKALVCTVGGSPYYGSEAEATAAKLPLGSPVRLQKKNGEVLFGTLKSVWIYEDLMFEIATESGLVFGCFGLGDTIEPSDIEEITG